MQGLATGFQSAHTDVMTWVIPLGALTLTLMALAGAVFWRHLLQHWVSVLLAVVAASSSLAVVTSIYNYFHL